ncbi:MAG: acetyltransferase [Eubacteriales bacterium]|nr:acetyltransferase [Eubacteriales bacterium]
MSKRLLLVGGGGHCLSIIDTLKSQQTVYDDIAIIDLKEKIGTSVMTIACIGCDDHLNDLMQNGFTDAFVSLGSIGSPDLRISLFRKIESLGFHIPNIIDPTAALGTQIHLGKGIYVGKNACINAEAKIGDGVIINTGSIIEHQCCIGAFAHIAPGAVLCGNVQVGEHTHIASGCVIKQGLLIGKNAVVGLGSVVLNNISDDMIAYGNPCKEVRHV